MSDIAGDFNTIYKLLSDAASASFYMDMRSRFASAEQWKVEGPIAKKHTYLQWYTAKLMIGDKRPELETYIRTNKETLNPKQIETFMAAIQVIDKEIERLFETEVLEVPCSKTGSKTKKSKSKKKS